MKASMDMSRRFQVTLAQTVVVMILGVGSYAQLNKNLVMGQILGADSKQSMFSILVKYWSIERYCMDRIVMRQE